MASSFNARTSFHPDLVSMTLSLSTEESCSCQWVTWIPKTRNISEMARFLSTIEGAPIDTLGLLRLFQGCIAASKIGRDGKLISHNYLFCIEKYHAFELSHNQSPIHRTTSASAPRAALAVVSRALFSSFPLVRQPPVQQPTYVAYQQPNHGLQQPTYDFQN
jgi:hypothetical protein